MIECAGPIHKAFLQVPLGTQKVDESPSNVQGTCRKPNSTDRKTPTQGERYHHSVELFFYLQVSERLNNSQR